MAKRKESMDGFIPRRPDRRVGGVIGDSSDTKKDSKKESKKDTDKEKADKNVGKLEVAPQAGKALFSRDDIDKSLSGIDEEEAADEPKKVRRQKKSKPKLPRRKWIKRAIIALLILLVAVGGYLGIRAIIASSNIFQGNIFDIFQTVPLKQDANGRTNIMVVGTSEDDPGHQGALLTDSMMILSIDQNRKNAYMISIPRDLYVKFGIACNSGYSGKINEYYNCVSEGTGVEQSRKALKKEANFVGKIFGLDMHYGINVNYTVMRQLVKAVGGSITITIESRNPNGVLDSNFDWKCGAGDPNVSYQQRLKRCPPRGHYIDYPNGPVKLDAEHALYLAMARGDRAPTYGFEQSNFDREKNQQKIIKALREKALSAGVLSDFNKVAAILDALGNNLRTTFLFKEFRTLVSVAQEIKSEDIQSISLIDGDDPMMTTGTTFGISIVQPTAGLYEYGELQAYIKQKLSSNPVVREAAPVLVLNGSGQAGIAQKEADKLQLAKYTLAGVGDAPAGDYKRYNVYRVGNENDGTAKALEKLYGVKITKGKPPLAVASNVKFVVIIGPEPKKVENNQ